MSHLLNVYHRLPITFTQGSGVWLWDNGGKKYLDAIAGIGVCGLGHAHPAVTETIQIQASKLLHVSNGFMIAQAEQLAEKLSQLANTEKAFFCNSGAEANETAIKLARLYGHHLGINSPHILVMHNGFHGRTLATISASGFRKIQAGYEPLVHGFTRANYNDIDAIQTIAHNTNDVVAILVEPMLGGGGIIVPDENYLENIREICDKKKWLLIIDEVQTGVARTGKFYAYQHGHCLPDIVCTAKGLANGIPIGACLTRGIANDLFTPGSHGTTFGGNPFACQVALTVIDIIENEQLISHAEKIGNYLLLQLKEKTASLNCVSDVRGKGLMIGIELVNTVDNIRLLGIEEGILFNTVMGNVIRLLPPLIINQDEADLLVEKLCSVLKKVELQHAKAQLSI